MQVAEQGGRVLAILRSVMALDLVAARARHARWASAARPEFVPDRVPDTAGLSLSIAGMRHPLLLQVLMTPCTNQCFLLSSHGVVSEHGCTRDTDRACTQTRILPLAAGLPSRDQGRLRAQTRC